MENEKIATADETLAAVIAAAVQAYIKESEEHVLQNGIVIWSIRRIGRIG